MPALLFCLNAFQLNAQIEPGVYRANETHEQGTRHFLLLISSDYFAHTVYDTSPNHFVETKGGHYLIDGDSLTVRLEFNSNYADDGEKVLRAVLYLDDGKLIFNDHQERIYIRESSTDQDLDGLWLFATRGPDTGQERRGEANPRKTLKFLRDGCFQWIAYHTETMKFSGTGGGRYTAKDGRYIETIQFFSRDAQRVGAQLEFQYELLGDDWHHRGNNSRGDPMYEIWSRRP
jgi:hypothetical protein